MNGAIVYTGEFVALPVLLLADGVAVEGIGVEWKEGATLIPTATLPVTRRSSGSKCRNCFVIIIVVVIGIGVGVGIVLVILNVARFLFAVLLLARIKP
jgi:hypothetical protein